MRPSILMLIVTLCTLAIPAEAGEAVQSSRWLRLDLQDSLPLELAPTGPEVSWDLSRAPATAVALRAVRRTPGSVVLVSDGGDEVVWRSMRGRGQRVELEPEAVADGELRLRTGTRRVVLRLERISSGEQSGQAIVRWVEPGGRTLVEARGVISPDGRSLVSVEEAWLSEGILAAADMKIYADQFDNPLSTELILGWDLGADVPVASVVSNNDGVTTIGDLVALDYWDFSGSAGGIEVAQTTIPLTAGESCNLNQCGYDLNDRFGRQDRNFDAPDPADRVTNNQVIEREDRVADVTIWLRAATLKEGVTGCFGAGESRICYDVNDGRPQVPLWRFAHEDADGWYLQAGDLWASDQFQCDQTVFNTVCGADPPGICLTPGAMWARACSDKSGSQVGEVLKGGVVTLPSGHTLNALLTRTLTEFCVYSGSACFLPLQQVRTVIHLWQVPWIGTAVLLQSDNSAPDATTFTTLAESNIGFGLYPPLATAVESTGTDSVTISWTPSRDTRRIDDYKVYWDTDSGAVSGYAFDSVANAGQVAFTGESATISGLTPGTTHYFTVVARYGHPRICQGGNDGQRCVLDSECGGGTCSGSETIYESILFPKQIEGDPGFVYPVEVRATTSGGSCTPTEEVTNLTMEQVKGGIQICWDPTSDPCLGAYDLSAASSPGSVDGFGALAQTGRTCWAGDPGESYYLVRSRGTGGAGPLGHYGE